MNTSKPIATISYNVVQIDPKGRRFAPYLENVLNRLVQNGTILFWNYIFHFAEDDECRKDHIHLYIEPAKKIDTIALASIFQEPDPSDVSAPPLGVMPIRSSNFENWYLYSIHDPDYLKSKGLQKKYNYSYDDVHSSNIDELYRLVHLIDPRDYQSDISAMVDAQSAGLSFLDYCKSGKIDLRKYIAASKLWRDISDDCFEKIKKEKEQKSENTEKNLSDDDHDDDQIAPDAILNRSPRGAYTYRTFDGQFILPKMCRAYVDPSRGYVYFCHNHSSAILNMLAKSGCLLDPSFVINSVNYDDDLKKII